MAENVTCCGSPVRLVAACSGRSNVGQIANRLMVEMDRLGVLKSFCITGVGAGLPDFVESARAADLILIDGCPTGCGKKVLENHKVEPKRYFVITELGIKKGDVDDSLDANARMALGEVMANI